MPKTKPPEYVKYAALSRQQKSLVDAAASAMEKAYNPYSHFYVGAALQTKGGKIISGANYENAAYSLTICAERSTIFTANNLGYNLIEAMAVITRGENFDTKEPTPPCGACRQVLYEASRISGQDIELILSTTKKDRIILTSVASLLPAAFGPFDIGVKLKKYKN